MTLEQIKAEIVRLLGLLPECSDDEEHQTLLEEIDRLAELAQTAPRAGE